MIVNDNVDNNPDATRSSRMRGRRDLLGRFKKRLSASASSTPFGRSVSSLAPSISVTGPDGEEVKSRNAFTRIVNEQVDKFITGIRSISADRASSRSQGEYGLDEKATESPRRPYITGSLLLFGFT